MPYLYTHQILAEQIRKQLPETVLNYIPKLNEFYLGAQGGDVFYFYKLREGQKNLGKYLHRKNIYRVFSNFLEIARSLHPSITSYIAGYITHYAGDIVFHPYIYARLAALEQEETDNWKGNRHALIESDLDGYYVQKFKNVSPLEYKYPLSYSAIDVEPLFLLLENSTEERSKKNVRLHAFKTALKRFFRYNRWLQDRTGGKKNLVYGFENFLKIPHTVSSLIHRADYDESYFNLTREKWHYPEDNNQVSNDGAEELFARATSEGVRLITLFFTCMEEGTPLPREDFSKHFLTGLPTEK